MKQQKRKKLNNKGFTLMEILLVALIFPLLILSVYAVLDMAQVIFRTDTVYSQLNQSSMQMMRYISREVSQTSPLASPSHLSITADAGGNSVLTFQVPVDWDNDGDVVQNGSTNVIEWGAYPEAGQTSNGVLNSWVRYQLTNGQLFRNVLDNTLNPVAGQSRMISDNVNAFQATQTSDRIQLVLTVQRLESTGQGGVARPITQVFTQEILMRNAVS